MFTWRNDFINYEQHLFESSKDIIPNKQINKENLKLRVLFQKLGNSKNGNTKLFAEIIKIEDGFIKRAGQLCDLLIDLGTPYPPQIITRQMIEGANQKVLKSVCANYIMSVRWVERENLCNPPHRPDQEQLYPYADINRIDPYGNKLPEPITLGYDGFYRECFLLYKKWEKYLKNLGDNKDKVKCIENEVNGWDWPLGRKSDITGVKDERNYRGYLKLINSEN